MDRPLNSLPQVTLAIHLYSDEYLLSLYRLFKPFSSRIYSFWFSSSSSLLLQKACMVFAPLNKPIETYTVLNTWHDWTSYLHFFSILEPFKTIVICNDSLISRHCLSYLSLRSFFGSIPNGSNFLIGELHTSKYSSLIAGTSSSAWICSYLFAFNGPNIFADLTAEEITLHVRDILLQPDHYFLKYLSSYRSSYFTSDSILLAKLGAMFLERLLFSLSSSSGMTIVDAFASKPIRKIESLIESFIFST